MLKQFIKMSAEAGSATEDGSLDAANALGTRSDLEPALCAEMARSFTDSFPEEWIEPPQQGGWEFYGQVINSYKAHPQGGVRCMYVDATEEIMITGGGDKTVKLWTLPRVQTVCCYREHKEAVIDAFILSRSQVVSCDHSLHVWDVNSKAQIHVLPATKLQGQCMRRYDDNTLLIGAMDNSIQTFDIRCGKIVCHWRVGKQAIGLVKSIAVHPESYTVAAGMSTGHIVTLDSRFGMIQNVRKAHDTQISSMLLYRDTLLSASVEKMSVVRHWNMAGPQMRLQHTIGGFDQGVAALGIYRDALFAASGRRMGTHEFGNKGAIANFVPIQEKLWKSQISAFAVMQCHNMLLLGSDDGNIRTCK